MSQEFVRCRGTSSRLEAMSVKFWIVGSPSHDVPYECQCVTEGLAWDQCLACAGTGTATYPVWDWGEVEVANMTGSAMFRCMGLEYSPGGEWSLDHLPEVRRRIISVLNRHDGTIQGEEAPYDEGRYHFMGLSSEQLRRRFQELLALLVDAQTRGCGIVWG